MSLAATEQEELIQYKASLLLGGLETPTEKTIDVLFPYDNSLVGCYEVPSHDQIEIALQRAVEGFAIISAMTPLARSKVLSRAAELILENEEDFAKLICMEVGKPIKQARLEVKRTADILKVSAEEGLRVNGEVIPLVRQDTNSKRLATFNYEPLGPVLAITPFNFPLSTVAHKIGPAIAAGNSVILKPSPSAPLTGYNLAKTLIKAGLPPQGLCVVNCTNAQTETLAQDYRLKAINFTGSSSVGWQLRSSAHPGTKTILELGGNAPVIVHEDADLSKAIPACIRGSFSFSGQTCISVQRLFLHDRILPDFLEQFIEATENLTIGNPLDDDTDLGPLVKESAVKRINLWVQEAVSEGAKLLTGGKILENNCYAPTVLREVKPKLNILCSEVFGPVVSIISYSNLNEAVAQANDSSYGLSAAIFTQNIDLAFGTARKLNAGTVLINDSSAFRADEMPTGGHNQSGLGLEGPKYAIREMSNVKVICANLEY
jgi:acyl-CoA reductase-like NAD-dependent aldehyde dehydrogenase